MINRISLLALILALSLSASTINAQDDESRQASGLPVMIGEKSSDRTRAPLSGKLTIQGLNASQPRPSIFAVVYLNGVPIDRRQVDDRGFYFVPNVPRNSAILAIEVSGNEIGRYPVPLTIMGNIRLDLSINLSQTGIEKNKVGVISASDLYQRSPENEKLYEKASLTTKDKKSDEAIKLFSQLVKNDPKDFVAWTEIGSLYFRKEKYSESEEAYRKALERNPDFIVALVNLGKLFLAQKEAVKSLPFLTKAVETEPSSPDAQHYLGEAYLQTQKGSKAVVHLNEAIKLAPVEKAEIHLRLAALYNAAGVKDRAVAEYKLFLEKVPQYAEKDKIEKYIKENSSK